MAAELNVTIDDDTGVVHVQGELDTHTSPQLGERLEALAPDTDVTLDLAATTFISSAGLTVILNAQRQLAEGGGSLRVSAVSDGVGRLIELSGLGETLGLS